MYLKPRSLEELHNELAALPSEKRKVIVLVGRHLNEGTHLIARWHHKEWEKVGAVAVKIPLEWTPTAFWVKSKTRKRSAEKVRKSALEIPHDYALAEFLRRKGFEVPVVAFHGWPQPFFDPYRLTPGIHLGVSENTRIPKSIFAYGVRFTHDSNTPKQLNVLTAELVFIGKFRNPPSLAFSYAERMTKRFAASPNKDELWFTLNPQLGPGYFHECRITKEALQEFSRLHSKKFKQMLAHLAKKGLR